MNFNIPSQPSISPQEVIMAKRYIENMKSYIMNDNEGNSDLKRNLVYINRVVDGLNDLSVLRELKELVSKNIPRDLGKQTSVFGEIEGKIDYNIKKIDANTNKISELKLVKSDEKEMPEQEEQSEQPERISA